jgi:hypothetical protein
MKNNPYAEHHFAENERLVHIPTGKTATYTGTRKQVKGIQFDFIKFDDGQTFFYHPYEITEMFRRLYNNEKSA